MSPVWWAVLAITAVVAFAVAVIGYLRWQWLLAEEQRAYAAEELAPLVVTLTIDTRPFVEAMRQVSVAMQNMTPLIAEGVKAQVDGWRDAMTRLEGTLRRIPNGPAFDRLREEYEWLNYLDRQRKLARASAVIGVRAGVDPAYQTPEALHALVVQLLHPDGMLFGRLTEPERRELAVAAMHGWVHGWGRNQPRPVLASAHHYGRATVTVVSP